MTESLLPDGLEAAVAALAPGPDGERLEEALAGLARWCGARAAWVGVRATGGPAREGADDVGRADDGAGEHVLARAGEPDGARVDAREGAAFAAGPGLSLWLAPAPAAGEGARRAQVAAGLVATALGRRRLAARARLLEDGLSAVTHDLNNALTPLLCGDDPLVLREAARMRSTLEVLRMLRGRVGQRDLERLPDLLGRVARLVGQVRQEHATIEVACDPALAPRAVGPEQEDLLPRLLTAAVALRGDLAPGAPLRLVAREASGAVVLRLEGRVADPGQRAAALALALDDAAPAPCLQRVAALPGTNGVEAPDLLVFELTLLRGARVLGVGPRAALARARAALAPAGVELVEAPADELDRVLSVGADHGARWSGVLVVGSLQAASALRPALHRRAPLLASRMLVVDEALAPLSGAATASGLAALLAAGLAAGPGSPPAAPRPAAP